MHLRGQGFEQEGEDLVNLLGINDVVVVEDEDDLIGEGGNLVD